MHPNEHFENLVMRAGFKSCLGCVHYGNDRTCKECRAAPHKQPNWQTNDRWLAAQKK